MNTRTGKARSGDRLFATIVITNHNYGRFLQPSIQSALDQDHEPREVIVVDDGSTDDSRSVIEGFGRAVRPIFKTKGGQTSALNTGFSAARGDFICFLDADDILYPTAMCHAAESFTRTNVVKVHWPLNDIDVNGVPIGTIKPDGQLSAGDLRNVVLQGGPDVCISPPTSGNAWARSFLEQVFPLPEVEPDIGIGSASADAYLSALAPVFGRVCKVDEPQGSYRVHGENDYASRTVEDRIYRDAATYRHRRDALARYCRQLGLEPDQSGWDRWSHFLNLHLATQEILAGTPTGTTLILVDENTWEGTANLGGRRCLPFLERDGEAWGPPADDRTAVRELERMRAAGADFIVFAWPAFWWFGNYRGFLRYVQQRYHCVVDDEKLRVFDLRQERSQVAPNHG
jgi:hypothetical protein